MADAIAHLNDALEGRYRIERELGEGGMATVYLTQDLKHQRRVALKVLKPELAAVLGPERFLAEIRTTANLQHPHILPLFDSGQAGTFLYYVMPFVEGETLRGRLDRERQLPVEEAVGIAASVADALDYAHRQGVVHRDIKPENILLREGQPLVADFGIAIALSAAGGGRMTETGLSLGTPHYMSPEQATAEKELTGRSDQYALGCVLYEALAGTPPHTGSSAQQVILRIVADEARPIRELRRSVPPNVADAIAKALEKLPADRFATAGDFASALRDPAFRRPGRERAEAGGTGWARRASRLPWLVAAAALVVAVIGWRFHPGAGRPGRPPASFVAATVGVQSINVTDLVERFAVSPDGQQIVYRSVDPQSGEKRLMLRRLGELQPSLLAGIDGMAPAFSPDGRWLAVVDGGRVLKVQLDGDAPPVALTDAAGEGGRGLSWGKDGIIRFFRTNQFQRLYWVPERPGGPVDSLVVRGDTVLWSAEPLDRGRLLLSITSRDQDHMVVRGADGTMRDLGPGRHASVTPTGYLLFTRRMGDRWSLIAAPFDPVAAEVTGEEVVLSSDVPVTYAKSAAVTEEGDLYLLEGEARSDRRIVLLDREGRERDTGFDAAPWVDVTVSPTGRRVVATRWNGARRSLWVGDLSSGTVDRITFDGDRFGPVWSPDERRIAFTYFPRGPTGDAGGASMWWVSTDGRGEPEPIGHETNAYPKSFRPDGRVLYYRQLGAQGRHLWAIDVTGGGQGTPLFGSRTNEDQGVVSPDGAWMAYESNASGRDEVRIAGLGDATVSVDVTSGGGETLGWSGDSRRLFYTRAEDVWEVQVGPRGPDLATRRIAFELPDDMISASVMPDGQAAVVVRGGLLLADLVVRQGALPPR
jgi:Tol biopolymer transport system component/tRNA A-37 threonylcarbamoyl transferase component Bud32